MNTTEARKRTNRSMEIIGRVVVFVFGLACWIPMLVFVRKANPELLMPASLIMSAILISAVGLGSFFMLIASGIIKE